MAFFTVQPGRSFHSVQEVFAADKPRLSISGWYHAAAPPEGSELATLTQLQTRRGDSGVDGGVDDDVADFVPFPSAAEGSDKGDELESLGPDRSDLEYLAGWVNPEYLNPQNVAQIRGKMEEDSSVQMREFLLPSIASAIRRSTRAVDEADKLGKGRVPARTAGVGSGWRALGPTHKQRYLTYNETEGEGAAMTKEVEKAGKDPERNGKEVDEPSPQPAGSLMHVLKTELFQSDAFARLLTWLTGLRPTAYKGEVRRFRPGLDYTVAHHGILTVEPRLDATLCMVDDEGEDAGGAWDFGEVGGFECYIAADEEGAAAGAATAEVYKAVEGEEEEEDELLSVSASFNTLSLVHRDEGLMRFVKYVGHLAPSSRWDVAMQYTVQAVEDSDEDEEEEGKDGEEEAAEEEDEEECDRSEKEEEEEDEEGDKDDDDEEEDNRPTVSGDSDIEE
jgi:hypothetical protein